MTVEPVCYRLSPDDTIEWVNEAWVEAAYRGGAPGLAESVLGTALWNHIAGVEIRHVYHELIRRARRSGRPVAFRLRCDDSTTRRLLAVQLVPLADGPVLFESQVVSEQPRSPTPLALPPTDDSPLHVCGWCSRVELGGTWLLFEDAVHQLGLLESHAPPGFSHGICQSCLVELELGLGPVDAPGSTQPAQ